MLAMGKTADISALQRFSTSINELRRMLAAPAPSHRELLLRSEMRRTILELSAALHEAAEAEPDLAKAAAFLAVSAAAADLGAGPLATAQSGH